MKSVLITGVKGQTGSYLADLLLEKGYFVVGVQRRSSSPDFTNIAHILDHKNFMLVYGDVTDMSSMSSIMKQYQPDECYNLAAMSFVKASWDQPLATTMINHVGVINCLEAIRLNSPKTKFCQASTSEVLGDTITDVQDIDSPLRPRSPYGAAKASAELSIKVHRESFGLFACFYRAWNHESPRRGVEFISRKLTDYIGRSFNTVEAHVFEAMSHQEAKESYTTAEAGFRMCLEKGIIKKLKLGNLTSYRDFSHAKDIARGAWMLLQQDKPKDFALCSGVTTQMCDLVKMAFSHIGIKNWKDFVEFDRDLLRPAEVDKLCGNYEAAKRELGWEPTVTVEQLIKEMVEHDILIHTKNVSN